MSPLALRTRTADLPKYMLPGLSEVERNPTPGVVKDSTIGANGESSTHVDIRLHVTVLRDTERVIDLLGIGFRRVRGLFVNGRTPC